MSKKSDGTGLHTGTDNGSQQQQPQEEYASNVIRFADWADTSAWSDLEEQEPQEEQSAPKKEKKETRAAGLTAEEGCGSLGSDMALLEFRLQKVLTSVPFREILHRMGTLNFWRKLRRGISPWKRFPLITEANSSGYSLDYFMLRYDFEDGLGHEPTHWDNRAELMEGYSSLIEMGANCETKDAFALNTHALYCFALERFLEGWESVSKLEALDKAGESEGSEESKEEDIVRELYSSLPQLLTFPSFLNNYLSRCNLLDASFRTDAYQLIDLLRTYPQPSSDVIEPVLQNVKDSFLANAGLLAFFDLEEAKRRWSWDTPPLVISSLDLELDLLPLEFVVDGITGTHGEKWTPRLGRPAMAQEERKNCFGPGTCGDAYRILVADSPDHSGADVLMYHKILKELQQDEDPNGKVMAQILMLQLASAVLGDLDAAVKIRSFTVSDKVLLRRNTRSLRELPKLLRELGYGEDATREDLEEKLHRTYTRTPDVPATKLRSDITSGWTNCWRLQEEYDAGKRDAFTHYLNMGIGASFVAWPKFLMNGSLADFTDEIEKELSSSFAQGAYRIIGAAEGTDFCYLDLLLWSTPAVVNALKVFFHQFPDGGQAWMQPFCCSFPPSPIDIDNRFVRQDAPES